MNNFWPFFLLKFTPCRFWIEEEALGLIFCDCKKLFYARI